MYPNIPYEGLSWPITQHAGVISAEVLRGLLEACSLCAGKKADAEIINNYLIRKGLLTANIRADRQKPDAWRDYQQILSELGLIYSTRMMPIILLTPVAIAFLDGTITYEELITLQIMKYQYPNGHKSQMSPSLSKSLGSVASTYSTFTELQASSGILVRPAVVIWRILYELFRASEAAHLTVDDLQKYVVRCKTCSDVTFCLNAIIQERHGGVALPAVERARRNMADWIKILNNSPLFDMDTSASTLYLSEYSIQHIEEILEMCNTLSQPNSFWIFQNNNDYKMNWFAFYGNIDLSINLIPTEKLSVDMDDDKPLSTEARTVVLQPFVGIDNNMLDNTKRKVVSMYDYNKTQKGKSLHDSMVNLIAGRCISKGAVVYSDPKTVDLCAKYKNTQFLIEVKSITPSNFIARLRYAIGQVHQYNHLLPMEKIDDERRLSLAFTADIPKSSWSIPFVTDYLKMDLLTLRDSELCIITHSPLSLELFSA